jgi:hypothetical protein
VASSTNPLDAIVSQLQAFATTNAPRLQPLDDGGTGSGIPVPVAVGSTGFNPVNTNDTGNSFPGLGGVGVSSTGGPVYSSTSAGPTGANAVTLGTGISANSASCAWYDVRCWGLQLIFILLGLICILGAIYLYKPTRDTVGGVAMIFRGSKAR